MRTLVYDDEGKVWPAQSRTLRVELGCPTADFDFLAYLVDTLGFILVQPLANGAIRIRLAPAAVSPVALGAMLLDLADAAPERVVLSYPEEGCGDELVAGIEPASRRITELVAAHTQHGHPTFLNQRLPIETLSAVGGPLLSLWRHWLASSGEASRFASRDMFDRLLAGRFMLMRPVDERLMIAEVGSGYVSFGARWCAQAAGRPVEEQPDYSFGMWTRQFFEMATRDREPRLDDIDAVIRRPHHGDQVRVRYRRLVLPFWDDPLGAPSLLSASIVVDTGLSAG